MFAVAILVAAMPVLLLNENRKLIFAGDNWMVRLYSRVEFCVVMQMSGKGKIYYPSE